MPAGFLRSISIHMVGCSDGLALQLKRALYAGMGHPVPCLDDDTAYVVVRPSKEGAKFG